VDCADARGNAQILGVDPYFDDLFCGAAQRRYVSCERLVETSAFAEHGCLHTLVLDRGMVDAVVEAPFGAHPTSCTPAYGIDLDHLKAYGAATTPEAWADYRARFVDVAADAYLAAVGGAERVSAIRPPIF
jgi:glutaconate CoA-transferase subunit A